MSYRIGVDIGGSFTDFAIFDETTSQLKSLKVFSRPDQPGTEIIEGIRLAQELYGVKPQEISYFTHGTTVGVNAVIQRKGLKLALFTTLNFEDVLEVARLKTPNKYDLFSRRPKPLISRDMVFGIRERIDAAGGESLPLDEAGVEQAVQAARRAGAEGIVIAFLHSYRNAAHELRAKAIVSSIAPDLPVFCSSESWPIIREYERTITAVIGGYVQPRVSHYLTRLQEALRNCGITPEPRLTKSNGGVMTAEQGKQECVQMILSGTASGVIGASYIAQTIGIENCMSLDIGGTSADVAVITGGQPQYGVGELIGDFQIFIPPVSVSSIGEGGGSIAWVDSQNVLRVGPDSAGSSPGPASFGKGGVDPTITDAFVCLGLIGRSDLGYNAVHVDRQKAIDAVGKLATMLDRSVEEVSEAIIEIAVSSMYSEVSGLISRFGIDPKEFSMLAFGGAGPMIACFLARELQMKEVVVPLTPGVLSALGGVIADIKSDFLQTIYADLDGSSLEVLLDGFRELRRRALLWLREGQGYTGRYKLTFSAEMRYKGQSFEIDTPLDIEWLEGGDLKRLSEAFHREHERVYEHADRDAQIQVISIRLIIAGETAKPEIVRMPKSTATPEPCDKQDLFLDGEVRRIAFYQRSDLTFGQSFSGPAVVSQEDCTTVIPAGFLVTVDVFGNLRITTG